MGYKARKRLALAILVIGLPAYIVLAVTVMNALGQFPKWVELIAYIVLGIGWIFPLRFVFLGIGQADPDANRDDPPA